MTRARVDIDVGYMAACVGCFLINAHGGEWDNEVCWFEDRRG